MTGMYNTYYDISKLTLWGDRRDGQISPRLTLSFRDGNPRFVVYTGDKDVKPINFPADFIIMETVLDRFRQIIDGPNGIKTSITSLGAKYDDNNRRTNEKRLVSTLYIGKNKEGIVYMLIKEESKPDIVFAFRKNEWHGFMDESSQEIPEATLSKYFAKAFVELTSRALGYFIGKYTEDAFTHGEYKPGVINRDFNNNNNKGGMKSYGSKGASKAAAMFDEAPIEDIPF